MPLSNELISEFIKVNRDEVENKKESTTYGTIVEHEGTQYVKLDGSDLLTPISTTTDAVNGERVTVLIKNHVAIVNGNISSPSARTDTVKEVEAHITETDSLVAKKADIESLDAANAKIDQLDAEKITAYQADIKYATIENLNSVNAEITRIDTEKLTAAAADIKYATIDELNATDATIRNLNADYGEFVELTTENFEASNASIKELDTKKLSATDADIKYANIDFSNIGQAAMEYFYATSGLIKDVSIGDATITGHLVGVTISGDQIEGNTIIAEKLVIKGTDGLYYKLNTDGISTSTEQTDYNSLNGSVIRAKSITATQISVKDLVAFDATIGGFNISDNSIYSDVKSTVDNTTRGIYLDKDGQVAFGDGTNFIKFYQDADGEYKLTVSAETMIFSSDNTNVADVVNEVQTSSGTNSDRLDKAESTIKQLVDSISTLVRGENGESLMTQTEDGWSFSLANVLSKLNSASNDIDTLQNDAVTKASMIDTLNQSVSDLGIYTDYIHFGLDNDQPCIILGETDSEFKVIITNTDIRFMEGTNVPASITNQSLHINKAVIEQELKQGGFVWMARSNGNYGLMWRGE